MKKITTSFVLLALLFSLRSIAQPLGPGSICFLALQTDAPDAFAFVAMQDIAANDTIYFTDNAWNGSAFFSNEQTLRWYSNTLVPQGTVIILTDPNNTALNEIVEGPGTALGKLPSLSSSGEQVLAYKLSGGNIIHLAGISTRDWLTTCASPDSLTGHTNETCLPGGLTNGVNAFAITNTTTDKDDIFFNIPVVNGTAASILSQIISNALNWTSGNDTAAAGSSRWPDWVFNFVSPNSAFVEFAGTDTVTLIENTGPQTFSLTLTNPLVVATSVTVQITQIGGAGTEDYTINPAPVSGEFQISFAPGQTTSSFTTDLLQDSFDETGEGITITIISASSDLIFANGEALTLLFTDLSATGSGINFFGAVQDVAEGTSYTVTLVIDPPATQPGNVTISSASGSGVTGNDFTTQPAIVANLINVGISQGVSTVSFEFTGSDDTDAEGAETISFTLNTASTGFSIGTASTSFTVTIPANDAPVNTPVLFINEVMSSNTSTIEDNPGEFDDWIEIYNPGIAAVNLAGMYISDDASNPVKHQFVPGNAQTIIPAGGYKLIWADDSVNQVPLHLNFKLSSNGEFVGLYVEMTGEGTVLAVVDTVTFPALGNDESYGRQVDGGLPWIIFTPEFTTPDATNEPDGFLTIDKELMSLYPNPSTGVVTIEIGEPLSNLTNTVIATDVTGRQVQIQVEAALSGNRLMLNLNTLSNGVYTLLITKQNGTPAIGKLVLQR